MLLELLRFLIIGIPCFVIGVMTTLVFMINEKYKHEETKELIRNKRISYILYLIGIVKRKRREESKIDVD